MLNYERENNIKFKYVLKTRPDFKFSMNGNHHLINFLINDEIYIFQDMLVICPRYCFDLMIECKNIIYFKKNGDIRGKWFGESCEKYSSTFPNPVWIRHHANIYILQSFGINKINEFNRYIGTLNRMDFLRFIKIEHETLETYFLPYVGKNVFTIFNFSFFLRFQPFIQKFI